MTSSDHMIYNHVVLGIYRRSYHTWITGRQDYLNVAFYAGSLQWPRLKLHAPYLLPCSGEEFPLPGMSDGRGLRVV